MKELYTVVYNALKHIIRSITKEIFSLINSMIK